MPARFQNQKYVFRQFKRSTTIIVSFWRHSFLLAQLRSRNVLSLDDLESESSVSGRFFSIMRSFGLSAPTKRFGAFFEIVDVFCGCWRDFGIRSPAFKSFFLRFFFFLPLSEVEQASLIVFEASMASFSSAFVWDSCRLSDDIFGRGFSFKAFNVAEIRSVRHILHRTTNFFRLGSFLRRHGRDFTSNLTLEEQQRLHSLSSLSSRFGALTFTSFSTVPVLAKFDKKCSFNIGLEFLPNCTRFRACFSDTILMAIIKV